MSQSVYGNHISCSTRGKKPKFARDSDAPHMQLTQTGVYDASNVGPLPPYWWRSTPPSADWPKPPEAKSGPFW